MGYHFHNWVFHNWFLVICRGSYSLQCSFVGREARDHSSVSSHTHTSVYIRSKFTEVSGVILAYIHGTELGCSPETRSSAWFSCIGVWGTTNQLLGQVLTARSSRTKVLSVSPTTARHQWLKKHFVLLKLSIHETFLLGGKSNFNNLIYYIICFISQCG